MEEGDDVVVEGVYVREGALEAAERPVFQCGGRVV